MPVELYANLANAKLDDLVYVAPKSRNSGTIVCELTAYFKSWDKDYGLVSLSLERDSDRVIVLSQGAITWVKSALTGEIVYTKDPRANVFGEAN